MKHFIITSFIIFILLLTHSSYSQVSGYMGKRNVLKAGIFMKSSFIMPNRNGESGYFNFNDRYSLEYERVITRNKSIQLRATTFETFYKTLGYSQHKTDPMFKMSCKAFGGDFIFYKASHIAPLGVYTAFGFDVIFSTAETDTAALNYLFNHITYDGTSTPRYTKTQISATHLGLNMKSGVKQIFLNCLSVDFNFQVGVIFSDNIVGKSKETNADDYLRGAIGNRLWGHYLWGVNCSVGYLF